MVSAYRVDTLRNPTIALQDFYAECNTEDTTNFPRRVSDHYAKVFQAPEAFHEVHIALKYPEDKCDGLTLYQRYQLSTFGTHPTRSRTARSSAFER